MRECDAYGIRKGNKYGLEEWQPLDGRSDAGRYAGGGREKGVVAVLKAKVRVV